MKRKETWLGKLWHKHKRDVILLLITLVVIILSAIKIFRFDDGSKMSQNINYIVLIVSALGLESIVDRIFFLLETDEKIDNINSHLQLISNLSKGKIALDAVFTRLGKIRSDTDRFNNAQSVTVIAIIADNLFETNYVLFDSILMKGGSLRVILMDPTSEALKYACENEYDTGMKLRKYRSKIGQTLDHLRSLSNKHPENVTVFLSELIPPYSLIAKNLDQEDSTIQVTLYSPKIHVSDRLVFVVNKSDTDTYDFYKKQIDHLCPPDAEPLKESLYDEIAKKINELNKKEEEKEEAEKEKRKKT